MKLLIFTFIIYNSIFAQVKIDTISIKYLYPRIENTIYYGHFMNLKSEEIQNYNKRSNNRLCVRFTTEIEDSVTFTINDKKIYQGKMKDRLDFIVYKNKIDSFSVLSMYSHKNQSKSDVILDLRMNSMQLHWNKYLNEPPPNYDYLEPLPYFWSVSYSYRICYNNGYEYEFPIPSPPPTTPPK